MRFALMLALAAFCATAVVNAADPVKTQLVDTKDMKASKEFKILKVAYGTKAKQKDLTKQFVEAMKKGQTFKADNRFGDPARGEGKTLEVVYTVNGQIKVASVKERQTLDPKTLK